MLEIIMTPETKNRIIYLYRITNIINGKIYIGQSIDPGSRWRAHRRDSADPKVPIQYAINKYGNENFDFMIIASCKTQDAANELETILVIQYDSYNNGYNATHGGCNAPKTETWRQGLKKWHASLSDEEKEIRKQKLREATQRQIQEKGHPAQGTKRTEEQRKILSEAQQNRNNNYTPEMRQRMSEAHLGEKHSKEAVENRRTSLMVTIAKKQELKLQSGEIKCHAPDCDRSGFDQDYRIVNNVRYCAKHAWRLKTKGTLYLPKN